MELIIIGLTIMAVSLYILAINRLNHSRFRTHAEKARWLTLIVVLPVIGPLIFFYHVNIKKLRNKLNHID